MPTRARRKIDVLLRRENIGPVKDNLAVGALIWIEIIHAVENAQQRGFPAARGTDERGNVAVVKRDSNVLECLQASIEEIKVPDIDPWRQVMSACIAWPSHRLVASHEMGCSITVNRCGSDYIVGVVVRDHQ